MLNTQSFQVKCPKQSFLIVKMFARKLVRPFGMSSQADLLNEIRALDKLCKANDPNIVKVLKHGCFSRLRYYYCIDMELCDLSLEQYIDDNSQSMISIDSKSYERAPLMISHVWGIMKDTASGLDFIHSQKEVHRDLKPSNGMGHTKFS